MRGKRSIIAEFLTSSRITPACAGKTTTDPAHTTARRDHPRVCGENSAGLSSQTLSRGSPPRVRGKPYETIVLARDKRITPACAGKTFSTGLWRSAKEDHPRVCGENPPPSVPCLHSTGSPPRVRGKHRGTRQRRGRTRITPACAGKTYRSGVERITGKDHPRVCGENRAQLQGLRAAVGSPPRVRGKPYASGQIDSISRITPACAGKT